jgi:hypothetical protein
MKKDTAEGPDGIGKNDKNHPIIKQIIQFDSIRWSTTSELEYESYNRNS